MGCANSKATGAPEGPSAAFTTVANAAPPPPHAAEAGVEEDDGMPGSLPAVEPDTAASGTKPAQPPVSSFTFSFVPSDDDCSPPCSPGGTRAPADTAALSTLSLPASAASIRSLPADLWSGPCAVPAGGGDRDSVSPALLVRGDIARFTPRPPAPLTREEAVLRRRSASATRSPGVDAARNFAARSRSSRARRSAGSLAGAFGDQHGTDRNPLRRHASPQPPRAYAVTVVPPGSEGDSDDELRFDARAVADIEARMDAAMVAMTTPKPQVATTTEALRA